MDFGCFRNVAVLSNIVLETGLGFYPLCTTVQFGLFGLVCTVISFQFFIFLLLFNYV